MLEDIDPMHEYFKKLGFEPEITDVYLALSKYGPQSLLQLSRNAKIERTRLYRLLDTLSESQLIEVETEYKRSTYKAAPLSNLQILLTKREEEVHGLQKELDTLKKDFQIPPIHSSLTHVQFYRGMDGIKQMLWNQTKTKTEVLGILFENIQHKTKGTFFDRWVERYNERGITNRSIVSDHFLQAQRAWYATHNNQKLASWDGRYISPDIFPITHSTVIYDDVVTYFNWQNEEIFGIEMYNQEIADTQRRFFEMLWTQGEAIAGHGEG